MSVKIEAKRSSLISPMNQLFLLMLLMKGRCFWMHAHQNVHCSAFGEMFVACMLSKSLSGGEDAAAVLNLSLPFKEILISPIL